MRARQLGTSAPQASFSRLTGHNSNLSNLNRGITHREHTASRAIRPYDIPNNHTSMDSPNHDDLNLDAILNQGEVFPEDLLLLLTEETQNIKNFKGRIQKQKLKVVNDMELFKKEINHIVDDLKISMMAELDLCYKTYIEKYAYLKSEIQEMRLLKKQIEAQNSRPDVSRLNNHSSNSDMVKEIEREVANLKSYKISQYINDIQKKKLFPVLELSKELIIMTSSPFEFYDAATTSAQLSELRANFSHFTKHMFGILKSFIRTPEGLLETGKQQFEEHTIHREEEARPEAVRERKDCVAPSIQSSRERVEVVPQRMSSLKRLKSREIQTSICPSGQALSTEWAEQVHLGQGHLIPSQHNDIVLCALTVKNKYIVSGSRDGLLNIMTTKGDKVATLRGHEASICCLALIEDKGDTLLASGSDHGCSSIIIWDTNSWNILVKMQHHTAAVTSIVDIGDGQTLVSGSYDKKINVYNYKTGSFLYSLPNNKASVFGIVLNSNKTKLVSGALGNGLHVWDIVYDSRTGTVETIRMEKLISEPGVLCSMVASAERPQLVATGTRDGKVKLWNIVTGNNTHTFNISKVPVIELVLLERLSKPSFPLIISAGAKDRALAVTNTETGVTSVLENQQEVYLEFGCGIGPKIVFGSERGSTWLLVVNQSGGNSGLTTFPLGL